MAKRTLEEIRELIGELTEESKRLARRQLYIAQKISQLAEETKRRRFGSAPVKSRRVTDEVRASVRRSISQAARGGGFTLRTTGGTAGTGSVKTALQMRKILTNVRTYIETALEYGSYPIRL